MNRLPATELDPLGHAYPRPQLQRTEWISLNGEWDFCVVECVADPKPDFVQWPGTKIVVPYSPETKASGVDDPRFCPFAWYKRTFPLPALNNGQRLLLHFGAVDYHATVWMNGNEVATHEGGYTPFTTDITTALSETDLQELAIYVEDDPQDLAKPRGKQDWKLEPHSIWYPRTTGIWQTVWLEIVPPVFLHTIRWTSNLEQWEIGLAAHIAGIGPTGLRLSVRLSVGDQLLSDDLYSVVNGEIHRQIALSDPGIDDYRNELLWSPSSPTLIDAELTLRDEDGDVLDRVKSYTALRAIAIQGDRFILNARPLCLRMVLDQGYWPESGLTAPNDDALLRDVLLAKRLGFNGVRKHQKIENPRFLYWADRMGLMVWEEMPSAYRYTRASIERLTREWIEVLRRDSSHPCIVAWVPFNESWGVPDLPESQQQRSYVQALYYLTKSLDPARPVIGNDGWESVATDIIGIHDYDASPERIAARYGLNSLEGRLFRSERPGGRMLLVNKLQKNPVEQPIMLTEFGGIAYADAEAEGGEWGYSRSKTPEDLLARYTALLSVVRSLPALAGFCYTQFTDTYQEANGLLFADRTPKAPLEAIALATRGSSPEHNATEEAVWRDRILERQR